MDKLRQVLLLAIGWVITAFTGIVIPLVILVCCFIVDYATGILAANSREQKVSSYMSFAGLRKKGSMLLLVAVGLLIDVLLFYLTNAYGVGGAIPFDSVFGAIICVWVICNELLSILENLGDIGINVPFLKPLVSKIQKYINSKVPSELTDESKEENNG